MAKASGLTVNDFIAAVDGYICASARFHASYAMAMAPNIPAERQVEICDKHLADHSAAKQALAELSRCGEAVAVDHPAVAVPVRETIYRTQIEATETSLSEFKAWWASTKAVLAASTDSKPTQYPLTDREQEVFNYIRENGPVSGKEICSALGIEQGSLTSQVIPKLKSHGVDNRRGVGYFIA